MRNALNTINEDLDNEDKVYGKRSKNDIKDLRSMKQLERLDLSIESPRFQKACANLGISPRECLRK